MDPDATLALAVKTLANQFYRYMESKRGDFVAKFEEAEFITDVQGRIIEHLYTNMGKGAIYQKDLEKRFNIRRSTATIILQRMERVGLIRREVSSDDARMKSLTLTERSIRMRPIAHQAIFEAEEQAKKGLTQEEIEVFFRVVKKILANIS